MKTRTQLVSNSSSTSYIISYKDDRCPHCGREGSGVMALLLAAGKNHGCEQTGLSRTGEEIIAELEGNIARAKKKIAEIPWRPDGTYTRFKPYRQDDRREWYEREIEESQNLLDLIKAIPPDRKVMEVEISYNDTSIQEAFDLAVKTGEIEILENEG